MGLKKHLNEFEKGQIIALHHEHMSMRNIADIGKRDASTVQKFLSRHKKGGTKQTPRKGTKLTTIAKRRLLRAASNGLMIAKCSITRSWT